MRLSDHNPVRTCRQLSPLSELTQAPVPTVPTQIVKLSAMMPPLPSAIPFRPKMRDVSDAPSGQPKFYAEIAVGASRHIRWLGFGGRERGPAGDLLAEAAIRYVLS